MQILLLPSTFETLVSTKLSLSIQPPLASRDGTPLCAHGGQLARPKTIQTHPPQTMSEKAHTTTTHSLALSLAASLPHEASQKLRSQLTSKSRSKSNRRSSASVVAPSPDMVDYLLSFSLFLTLLRFFSRRYLFRTRTTKYVAMPTS